MAILNFKQQVEQLEQQKGVAKLINALKAWHPQMRELAAQALGRIKDPDAILPLVVCAYADRNSKVREHALVSLWAFGDPSVEFMIRYLSCADRGQHLQKIEAVLERCIKAGFGKPEHELGMLQSLILRLEKVRNKNPIKWGTIPFLHLLSEIESLQEQGFDYKIKFQPEKMRYTHKEIYSRTLPDIPFSNVFFPRWSLITVVPYVEGVLERPQIIEIRQGNRLDQDMS